jgi:hypothetical protein
VVVKGLATEAQRHREEGNFIRKAGRYEDRKKSWLPCFLFSS